MSMNIDCSKVENWQEIWGKDASDKEQLITEAVMWGCQMVGIYKITEENWEEYYRRVNLMFQVGETNFMLSNDGTTFGERIPITPADVHRRIGLSTNANTMSKTAFAKKVMEYMENNVNKEIRKYKESVNV